MHFAKTDHDSTRHLEFQRLWIMHATRYLQEAFFVWGNYTKSNLCPDCCNVYVKRDFDFLLDLAKFRFKVISLLNLFDENM